MGHVVSSARGGRKDEVVEDARVHIMSNKLVGDLCVDSDGNVGVPS